MRAATAFSTFASLFLVTTSAALLPAQEAIRFSYRGLDVGEQTVQQVSFEMELSRAIQQSGQVIDSASQAIQRGHTCQLTVLELAEVEGQSVKTKVRIAFDDAQQSISDGQAKPQPDVLPVAGKAYLVQREAGNLVITDEQGRTPSPPEQMIVATNTSTLGKPNPIARYFHGRTVRLGEKLRLPPAMAKDLLGFGGRVDTATAFELTLADVRELQGATCGLFETRLVTNVAQGTKLEMEMRGKLLLETNTCRARWIELGGPVSMSEVHGPAGGQFTIDTTGTLKMALRADYPRPR